MHHLLNATDGQVVGDQLLDDGRTLLFDPVDVCLRVLTRQDLEGVRLDDFCKVRCQDSRRLHDSVSHEFRLLARRVGDPLGGKPEGGFDRVRSLDLTFHIPRIHRQQALRLDDAHRDVDAADLDRVLVRLERDHVVPDPNRGNDDAEIERRLLA